MKKNRARLSQKESRNLMKEIIKKNNADLKTMKQEDLEKHWHFRWNDKEGIEENLYRFCDRMDIYGSFCYRWERIHNGHDLMVERVRDKYLMPKIKEFSLIVRVAALCGK